MKIRAFIICSLLFCWCGGLSAQDADSNSVAKKAAKRPWYLTLGTGTKFKSLQGYYTYHYEGEYDEGSHGPFGGNDYKWVWREYSESMKNIFSESKFYNANIDINLSRNNRFRFGMYYNFGMVLFDYDWNDTTVWQRIPPHLAEADYLLFLGIGLRAEYNYYFKDSAKGSPFVFGSIGPGFYRSDAFLSGPGSQLFAQFRIGTGYHSQNNWIFRLFASADQMYYRDRSISPVFNRRQVVDLSLRNIYVGVEIFKQFVLVPD